jgi:hypothetical protein
MSRKELEPRRRKGREEEVVSKKDKEATIRKFGAIQTNLKCEELYLKIIYVYF